MWQKENLQTNHSPVIISVMNNETDRKSENIIHQCMHNKLLTSISN